MNALRFIHGITMSVFFFFLDVRRRREISAIIPERSDCRSPGKYKNVLKACYLLICCQRAAAHGGRQVIQYFPKVSAGSVVYAAGKCGKGVGGRIGREIRFP